MMAEIVDDRITYLNNLIIPLGEALPCRLRRPLSAPRVPSRAVAGRSYWKNSAIIVGKGEGGGKLDQGSDDTDPGYDDQQQEQGIGDAGR